MFSTDLNRKCSMCVVSIKRWEANITEEEILTIPRRNVLWNYDFSRRLLRFLYVLWSNIEVDTVAFVFHAFFLLSAVPVGKFKHVLGVTRLLLHACCYIYSFCCWRLFIPPAVKSETYFSALFRIMFMWKNDQTVFVSFPPIDCLTVKKVIRLFSNEKTSNFQ